MLLASEDIKQKQNERTNERSCERSADCDCVYRVPAIMDHGYHKFINNPLPIMQSSGAVWKWRWPSRAPRP